MRREKKHAKRCSDNYATGNDDDDGEDDVDNNDNDKDNDDDEDVDDLFFSFFSPDTNCTRRRRKWGQNNEATALLGVTITMQTMQWQI
jgi:hypothetical protein